MNSKNTLSPDTIAHWDAVLQTGEWFYKVQYLYVYLLIFCIFYMYIYFEGACEDLHVSPNLKKQ